MPKECIVPRYGGPEVLTLREKPRERVGLGQVRIKVAFAGVNFADLAARAGVYGPAPKPPFSLGFEVSGTIEEAAEGSGFDEGDRVLAVTRFGGYTDEVVIDAVRARKIPGRMTLEEAAALPAQYLTAYHALVEVAHAKRGEKVLVHAVAGGVGTATVQLCKHFGLTSFGTASSEAKLAFARGQGLDHGINYEKQDFEEEVKRLTDGEGVDIALDANGGASFGKSYECLARGGRLIIYGAAAALPKSVSIRGIKDWPKAALEVARQKWFHPFELISRNASVCGLQLLLMWDRTDIFAKELEELVHLYERGAVRPVVDEIFRLREASAAHRYLHERRTRGKVLLQP